MNKKTFTSLLLIFCSLSSYGQGNITLDTVYATQCNSFVWRGSTYSQTGLFKDTVWTDNTHTVIDSVCFLNLTIHYSTNGSDIQNHCDTYKWIDGNTYTTSTSTPTYILTNAMGCDSIVTLNLTIRHTSNCIDLQSHCDTYTWIDGNTYTASTTTPTDTLTNAMGCDSVVTLNLIIRNSNTGIDTQSHCDRYTWIDGNTYTASTNTQTYILTNAFGCDSTVTLNLTVRSSTTRTDYQTQCDSYTWVNGTTYTASTTSPSIVLAIKNAANCDSIVQLNLTINQSNTGVDTKVKCDSYTWIDGNTYTTTTSTPTFTMRNTYGCDSTVTLHLTINNSTVGIDQQNHCDSYTWADGILYTESTSIPTRLLTNALGCDSIVTLNLTIRNSNTGIDVQSHCDTYTWLDGNTYTASTDIPTDTLTNAAGCDSIVTLNLTIHSSNTGIDAQSHCDTYTWIDGNTYTASTVIPTDTLTNAAGCDSIVTLNLTIRSSNTGIDVQSHCDTYTWIDGNTYTASTVIPTDTLTNAVGCDSIVTLNLTIRSSNTGTDAQSHCDTYTWIDGNTYTVSTDIPTDTLTNAVGCDSIVTLNLTIHSSNTGIDAQSHCDTYTWIDGNTYTVSTDIPTDTLTNAVGCDSIVTLNLTIRNSTTGTDEHYVCGPFEWINGITYDASTVGAIDTIINMAGCDSIVTLDLTIRQNIVLTKWTDVVIVNDKDYGPFEGDNCSWYYCVSDTVGGELIGTGLYKQVTASGYYYVIAVKGNDTIVSCSQYMNPTNMQVYSYPNPTESSVSIQGGNWNRGDMIAVLTLTGNIVIHSTAQDDGYLTLDLSGLPDDIYFIKVGSEVVKVIKR